MGFRAPFGSPLASILGPSAAAAVDFADTLVNDYGASEIFKLSDIVSGTTIPAYVDSVRNGTLQGWSLQNAASPIAGDAGLVPDSNGSSNYGNIRTTSGATALTNVFDPATGSIMIFARVRSSGVWSDGVQRRLMLLDGGNVFNRIALTKLTTANVFAYTYSTGGVTKQRNLTMSTTNWFSPVMTWNKAADRVRYYLDGVQDGADDTGLGTWSAGALTTALLGAFTTVPAQVWNGWMAWAVLWFGTELTPSQVSSIYTDAVG